ncbi:hypothetical protein LPJ53_004388, partial [Coemansia erecta]
QTRPVSPSVDIELPRPDILPAAVKQLRPDSPLAMVSMTFPAFQPAVSIAQTSPVLPPTAIELQRPGSPPATVIEQTNPASPSTVVELPHPDSPLAAAAEKPVVVAAPLPSKVDSKQASASVGCHAIPAALATACTSEAPAQTECSDCNTAAVAGTTLCILELSTQAEISNKELSEDQPGAEQVQEPPRRRRPTRRGKGSNKRAQAARAIQADQEVQAEQADDVDLADLAEPAEPAEPANQADQADQVVEPKEQPEVESPPMARWKTRRSGKVLRNKMLLGELPRQIT